MKRRFSLVVLMLALLPVLPAGAQPPSATRRFMSSGRPIAEQLKATDRNVTLEINAAPPLTVAPPNGESRVGFIARQSDAIVIARLESKVPRFVQRSPIQNTLVPVAQANWIVSLVRARVERVIKDSPVLMLAQGTPLVFEEDGGVATIGKARVETIVPWVRPLIVGRRYLLAGTVRDGHFIKGATYEEGDDGLLKSLRRLVESRPGTDAAAVRDEPDEFEAWAVDEVISRLRAVLNR